MRHAFETTEFHHRQAYGHYLNESPIHARRCEFEGELIAAAKDVDEFKFNAWCSACDTERPLIVDRLYGSKPHPYGWLPNWRERLVCPGCGMNNRVRAMIHALRQAIGMRRTEGRPTARLYAIEQLSPFFRWIESHLPIECTGSEYLGAGVEQRARLPDHWRHVRHEDVEALSFDAGQFDLLVANDVLEHVNEPLKALGEISRVLRPGGELYLSVPFLTGELHSARRAELTDGQVKHLQPAQYHANPLSESGSLVFHDYGWDLLDWLRDAGFIEACMRVYWSRECGYLGDPLYYFHAVKPDSL